MSDQQGETWTILGVVIALAGLAAGVLLWLAASARYDDAIDALAPAPVGCDTTLEFDRTGTFFIFAETKGEVGELDGDCANDEQAYEGTDDNLDIVMFDADSNEVELERETDRSYDNGDSLGEVLYSVEIDSTGDYTLRVQGGDDDVVARVGSDPNDGVGLLRIAAIAALAAGAVLGLAFILLGRRRRSTSAGPDSPSATGWGDRQDMPPAMPPYTPSPTPGHHPAPGWGVPGQPAPPQPTPPQPTPGGGWGVPSPGPPSSPPSRPWQPPSG